MLLGMTQKIGVNGSALWSFLTTGFRLCSLLPPLPLTYCIAAKP